MNWLRERVWQMGLGALMVLIGAAAIYGSAVTEPVNSLWMWVGLILIFGGLGIPLLARLFESMQEEKGEEGET